MIKAVVFDLAEVYLQGFFGIEERLESIVGSSEKVIAEKVRGEPLVLLFKGRITEEEYWNRVKKRGGWKVDIEQFKKAVRENFVEINGTREILEVLSDGDYKLSLISDHVKEWIEFCEEKFDYHKLFDEIVYSFEDDVSALKTDGKPFEIMLERLSLRSEQCLFIDDLGKNLEVARNMGMKEIQFQNAEQLKKNLQKHSINLK